MAKLTQIALVLLLSLFHQSLAAPFSLNSITLVVKVLGVGHYLREYSYDGTSLQNITISLITNTNGIETPCPRGDSAGTTIAIPLNTGSSTPFQNLIYMLNAQAEITDITNVTNPTSFTRDVIVEGQDIWIQNPNRLYYVARGTSVLSANILSGVSSGIFKVQLVGTRLFVLVNLAVRYMDPIVKTGSATTTAISGTTDLLFFFMHGPKVMYAIGVNSLIKYSVTDAVATKQYEVTITDIFATDNALNCYSMDVNGVRYVFVVSGTSYSRLERFTDDGSAFVNNLVIDQDVEPVVFLGVGPSAKPTCTDGYLNQDESDIDCGGVACGKCAIAKTCKSSNDCQSTYCNAQTKICTIPTCFDGVKNGNEADVDCGIACEKGCRDEQTCNGDIDCLGYQCDGGYCIADCIDTIQNQGEIDVDCGGPCKACVNGKKCVVATDCELNYCNPAKLCSTPSCSDGFLNQNETDVDCGGQNCPSLCAIEQSCMEDLDCMSNTCVENICVNAPVAPSTPVAVPVSSTPSDSTPVTQSEPSSTPSTQLEPSSTQSVPLFTPKTQVSRASIVEMSILGLGLGFITLTF